MNVRDAGSYLRLGRVRGAKERLDVRRDRGSRRSGHAAHGLFRGSRTPLDCPTSALSVLRKPAVVVPNAAIFLQSMVGIAWLYVLTLYFQEVLGHSPLTAGLLFSPMTLASVLGAPVA